MISSKQRTKELEITYQDNVALAQKVLKNLKKTIISSNDIISRVQLPHFYANEIGQYINKFGEDKVKAFVDYMEKSEKIRQTGFYVQNKFQDRLKYPVTSRSIAITYFGVGECQEMTNRAMLELGFLGKSILTTVLLKDKPDDKVSESDNTHGFLVIGDSSSLSGPEMNSFKKLSNNCVLFDLFLGVIGQANQTENLIGEYLKIYQLSSIFELTRIDPSINDISGLQKESLFFKAEMEKILEFNFSTKNASLASAAFISATNPISKCIQLLKDACKNDAKGQEILGAINNKSYSLAFRKACAYGEENLIDLLLANRALLRNFDLNELSSNGFTAVDWVENAKYEDGKKKSILDKIIPAGALSGKQKKSNETLKAPLVNSL